MAASLIAENNTLFYSVAKIIVFPLFRVLYPVRYYGIEKIRDGKGPRLLISNHRHALDPLVIAYSVREQCVFLGKKELADNPIAAWFLKKLHCIFVDRHNTDLEAMRSCMKALKLKKTLVIFPEGTRYHQGQMEHIENGTSLIALRGKVPLIPIYLDGTLRLFHRINVYVGDPIQFDDLIQRGANVDTCNELNRRMKQTYRTMIRDKGDRP